MRLIIEAPLVDDEGSIERIELASIERAMTTDPLGMSLAEGKALLAAAQQHLVDSQCQGIASAHAHCERCDAKLALKGWHQRQIKTVFGLVIVQSPRVRYCRCANTTAGASFSPLTQVLPTRMTQGGTSGQTDAISIVQPFACHGCAVNSHTTPDIVGTARLDQ